MFQKQRQGQPEIFLAIVIAKPFGAPSSGKEVGGMLEILASNGLMREWMDT
jgi:hypothetical protein